MLIKKKKKEEKEFSSIFLIHLKNCTSTQKKKKHMGLFKNLNV